MLNYRLILQLAVFELIVNNKLKQSLKSVHVSVVVRHSQHDALLSSVDAILLLLELWVQLDNDRNYVGYSTLETSCRKLSVQQLVVVVLRIKRELLLHLQSKVTTAHVQLAIRLYVGFRQRKYPHSSYDCHYSKHCQQSLHL